MVAEKKDATLAELCAELAQKNRVLVSRSTVDRMLKRLNLTVKKTIQATEKYSEQVQQKRVVLQKI
ncbi:MAG: winged helix-turn-helix domain-containing protein [Chroococcidiopsidaceae cyanobacterium CP_BM_ER_R8_30]|nr:winged helix-turn-helix domain-containing protein [Chroococcidiopsidaceae cyanobacterium CP_BM_ER_R8_30]